MGIFSRLRRAPAPPKVATRRFDAAAGGRRWESHPHFGRTGAETLAASAPIRSRARYFAANNAWASNGVGALVAGLVGTGITPASAHPDPVTRARIGSAFAAWGRNCDADGRTDLYGLQAAAVSGMITDGEAFLHLEQTAAGLRLRLLPPEMVDESDTRELPAGAHRVAGVEFDASGHRVAYMILPHRPTDTFATSALPIRVRAEEVIHLMRPLGAGQVRGVSWLAPILLRLAELDALEDALAVGVKVAALHAGFLVDQNGTATDFPFEGTPTANVLESGLEPGTLRYLPAGWDIKFSTPQQAQQSAEFVSHQIRAIAAGLGVPAHLVSGDLRDANYGSLRAGMIAFRQRLEQVQFGTIIPQLCQPIFERAIASLALSGDLDVGFERAAAEHYPPPMPWIDPAKDAAAIRERLTLGLMSRRQAVAELGYSVEALDVEIAADREREQQLELTFGAAPKVGESRDDA